MKETVYGLVNDNLEVDTLENLCVSGGIQTGPFGSQLHQKDYLTVGTPIITVEHLGENRILHQDLPCVSDGDKERLSRYVMQKGDIIFSRVGSVDRRALVRDEEDGWLFSGRCLRVRPDNAKIDSEYLSWFFGLETFKDYIRRIAVGATMPSLNTELLSNVPVIFPPLPEQRAIAEVLGALDDTIELNRRMNRTLEALAKAVFRQWFVESEEVASWNVGKLSEICTTQYGFTASASDEPVGPKFLRITDMNKEPWIVWADVPYCEISEREFEKYRLSLGDILVSRIADPGKAGIVEEEVNAVFASYLVRLKFKDLAWSYFAYYFLRSEQYLEYANGAKSGSVQSGMNARVITDVNLSIPPDEKVVAFLETIIPLRNKVVANLKQSRTLAALRDALLPKLMRGEVRVRP